MNRSDRATSAVAAWAAASSRTGATPTISIAKSSAGRGKTAACPAQPFAVENDGYGGTDAFKSFVHACHLRGIAVKDFAWGKDAKGAWQPQWRPLGEGMIDRCFDRARQLLGDGQRLNALHL